MSWVNCSVKVSPHEPMGDTDDESEGNAAGGLAQGRRGGTASQCAGGAGPGGKRAPCAAPEAAVSGGGASGIAASQPWPALGPRRGAGRAPAGGAAAADDVSGPQ